MPFPQIPGYEIDAILGSGGMGTVYKGRQVALDRTVAVKVLDPEFARDDDYVARFVKEARIAGRLRHQNVVGAIDCGIAAGNHYMIMEFVEGKSLDEIIKERGALDERVALEIVRQACEGLEYAWRHHIVHRDIKPRNILLTADGTAKICDLGLARAVQRDPSLTATGHVICTPAYASPEQARGRKDIDCRSDIYSLGVSFYELVTGSLPFRCDSPADYFLQHATAPRIPPSKRNPAVSDVVSALILEMLDPDPAGRPPTPKHVTDRIRLILLPPAPRESKPSKPTGRREVLKLAGIDIEGPLGLSTKVQDEVGIIALRGKLLETLDIALKDQFDRLIDNGVVRIIVDCSRLDYLSSRGVSVFIAVLDACREADGDLFLAAAPPQPKFVLDRLGVTLILRHFPTVEEALNVHRDAPKPHDQVQGPTQVVEVDPPARLPVQIEASQAPPAAGKPASDRRTSTIRALVALVLLLLGTCVALLIRLQRTTGFLTP